MKRALIAVLLGGLCGVSAMASTFVLGMENSIPGSPATVEGIGDFNDLMVSLQATGLTLVSTDGGSWSAFSAGIVNENQTYPTTNSNPFWDNQSLDGSHMNIGYCLTTNNCGLGGSAGTPVDGVTEYLHGAGGIGSTDDGFYFTFNGQVTTINLGAISLQSPNESLGWYTVGGGPTGVIIPLGSGGTPGDYSFTPGSSNFGLWFYVNGTYYFSQTSVGGAGAPANRFAVFSLPESGVPEPGTMALFGLGALALGLVPRLRKRRN